MRTFFKVILAMLFIVLIMTISFREKKTEWKGTIEEEYGLTVVKNPKKPIYRNDVFSLKEDLALGKKERNEEHMFFLLTDMDADSAGNIYVLDSEDVNIKVYDQKGRFLKVISRKGQGPGKLLNPEDKLFVLRSEKGNKERSFFDIFDSEGKYSWKMRLKIRPMI